MNKKKMSFRKRFWAKVNIGEEKDCWEWQGAYFVDGYGQFYLTSSVKIRSNRMAWTLANGLIPKGLCVLHLCNNRKCVNPKHLYVGTRTDNAHDRLISGNAPKGEDHKLSKLTEQDVIEIREKYIPRKYSQYKLAQEYGVTRTAIEQITTGRNWKHLL